MEASEYKKIVDKTAVFPKKVDDFSLAYATMGLIDEIGELLEEVNKKDSSYKSVIKEAGDVVWYCAAICQYAGLDFVEVINKSMLTKNKLATSEVYKIPGMVKKYYRDDKPIDKKELGKILSDTLSALHMTSRPRLNDILQINYDKLSKRLEQNQLHGDGSDREENIK